MRLARVALFLLLWCWNQSGPLSIPVQRNEDARVVAKVVRGVLWNKILYRSGNYVCGGLLVTFLVEAPTSKSNQHRLLYFNTGTINVSQRTASRVTTCRYESRSIHCLGQRRRRLRSYVAKAKTLVPSPNGTRPPANPPSYSSATTTRSDTTILHGFHGVFLLFNVWFALASAETCSTLLRVCCFQHLQHVSLHFEI
jgi:hypothetical protein